MRILVIESNPEVAKLALDCLEGHELVDMKYRALQQKDMQTLGENAVVSCSKVSDEVDDEFALVFCRKADEYWASEYGKTIIVGMTDKSKTKDKRTIQNAIDECESEPSLYEEEEIDEEEYYSYYSGSGGESEEEDEDSDKK